MTKDEAILTAAKAQRAAMQVFLDYPLDSPQEAAATETAQRTWREAIALGAAPAEIRAATQTL